MGIRLILSGGSSSSSDGVCRVCAQQPSIRDFEVLRRVRNGDHVLVEVRYGNTSTYEGRKIMILKMTDAELDAALTLDPHFSKDGPVVARFEPTFQGTQLALNVLALLGAIEPP